MTYSIIARDPRTGELGGAIQSKFPGVGTIALHGRVEVGIVATQAFADPAAAQTALELMAKGAPAEDAVRIVLDSADRVADRQFAALGPSGKPHGFSGEAIASWNGSSGCVASNDCIACGNALSNDGVLAAMVQTFDRETGSLANRLLAALSAGRDAGGELRGEQAAALLVVQTAGGYGGLTDRKVDISIYDHPAPIEELKRCYALHRLSYFPSDPAHLQPIVGTVADGLKRLLRERGYDAAEGDAWQEQDISALARMLGEDNYDNRIHMDGQIDGEVLDDLRKRFPDL